nr:hypothetical protein [Luteolibacter marinus]
MAIILPGFVTTAGCLLVAPVILCSPITANWSTRRRAIVYLAFAGLLLGACAVAGLVSAAKIGKFLF